ncbi:MAG: protein-glutamate O-methyltransferase CheR [Pseudomonadota bacterium]
MQTTGVDINLSDGDFFKLRKIIHDSTGITIGDERKSMLVSRLRSRLRETEEPSFKSYISRVSSDRNELQQLINRVTTNETYCYRTPRVWSYFRETFLPTLRAERLKGPMRVWSGAASTGEEGHTIGVVLEHVRQTRPGFDYRVLGTDVSSRVLEIADEGLYRGKSINRFQKEDPELFGAHMKGNDVDGYRVAAEIKKRLKFKRHNLLDPLSTEGPFHTVFLRNVLIYFTQEDQEKILSNVHDRMCSDSILIIGESETLKGMRTRFEPVAPMIYQPLPKGGG